MDSLVVLLLAERARSEGVRSTRTLEDQPGYPVKSETRRLEGKFDVRNAWQVAPWSPSVGFRCRTTWAGEDLVKPF
jgi:hypothetical protein